MCSAAATDSGVCVCVAGGKTPDMNARTYAHIMQEARLKGEEALVSVCVCLCVSLCVCVCYW